MDSVYSMPPSEHNELEPLLRGTAAGHAGHHRSCSAYLLVTVKTIVVFGTTMLLAALVRNEILPTWPSQNYGDGASSADNVVFEVHPKFAFWHSPVNEKLSSTIGAQKAVPDVHLVRLGNAEVTEKTSSSSMGHICHRLRAKTAVGVDDGAVIPDVTDRDTIIALATMSSLVYNSPDPSNSSNRSGYTNFVRTFSRALGDDWFRSCCIQSISFYTI